MAAASALLRYLRTLAEPATRLSDRELLQAFADRCEEDAFTVLLKRHGPMVWGVCRRVLAHEQDAEDAFQATFLVLARKARSLAWQESVGTWLYEVASRIARDARQRASRRREREGRAPRPAPAPDPLDAMSGRDLLDVLAAEIAALPADCRAPLIHCYLEGRTGEEAARELGCSTSTLKRRLDRGRELLRARLAGRGITLPAAALAALLTAQVAAAVPTPLLRITLEASCGTGLATPNALALANEGMAAMTTKGKTLLLLGTFCVLAAVGLMAAAPGKPDDPPAKPSRAEPSLTLDGHKFGAQLAAFIDGGKAIVTADLPGTVRVVDAATGRERRSFKTIQCSRAALSPDGRAVAVGGWNELAVYELKSGKEVWKVKNDVDRYWGVGFSADGKYVVSGDDRGAVRLHAADSGKPAGVFSVERPLMWRRVVALAVQPGGSKVAYGTIHDVPKLADPKKRINLITLRLRDLESGREEELATYDTGDRAFWGGIPALAFAGDGRRLAAAVQVDVKEDKVKIPVCVLRMWDVQERQEIMSFGGHHVGVAELAFTPDGRTLAGLTWDGKVSLWETASGKLRAEVHAGTSNFGQALAFTADGRRLLTGLDRPRVWDVFAAAPEREAKALWADLGGEDAAQAHAAARALLATPEKSVPFLDERIRAAVRPDVARIRKLIAELDDDRFAVREAAVKGLRELAELAHPLMARTLASGPTPEARRRLKPLLTAGPIRSVEALRLVRAVEALEHIGTAEARRVLDALARELPDTWTAAQAKPAAERLRSRR
jgi:RNA polymerase sigma factor (sigma-70 family)